MTRTAEPFEMVPRRVFDAFQRDELDLFDFAILVFLIGAVDRRTGVTKFTLVGLGDDLDWRTTKTSTDWLRKRLRRLRQDGWIDYPSTSGQKQYVVTLVGAAVAKRTENGLETDSSQTPNLGLKTFRTERDPASRGGLNDSATSDSAAPRGRDVDVDVDVDERHAEEDFANAPSSLARDRALSRRSPVPIVDSFDGPLASCVGDQIARLEALARERADDEARPGS